MGLKQAGYGLYFDVQNCTVNSHCNRGPRPGFNLANVEYWGNEFGDRKALNEPHTNIGASAEILKRIRANLPSGATVQQIATFYNNINADTVSDYGA